MHNLRGDSLAERIIPAVRKILTDTKAVKYIQSASNDALEVSEALRASKVDSALVNVWIRISESLKKLDMLTLQNIESLSNAMNNYSSKQISNQTDLVSATNRLLDELERIKG